MKRLISFLLALVLLLTIGPVLPVKAEARTGGKLIDMTFDDGPSSRYTMELLDGLKERGVPVTFFILGDNADNNRELVRRAYEEGHEIACHTWDHPNLTTLSKGEVRAQISSTLAELERATGKGADFLVRPPYGSTNATVRAAIDYPLVHWSVDSLDWDLKNTAKVRAKIVDEAYDGSIILCHDIHKTTIPAALGAIDDLMDMGYEFVTVSELFRRRGRELKDHEIHYSSKKNGTDYGPIPKPTISCTSSGGKLLVTISCSDKDAPIYYTTDGSYPNQSAKKYTGPFTVDYFTEITAVAAYKLNGSRSKLAHLTEKDYPVLAPTITQNSDGAIVMTTPTPGTDIYFTIDNTKPDAGDLLYTGPEYIVGGCHIRAITAHDQAGISQETRAYLSEDGDLYYDIADGQWFYEAMDWAHRMGILNGIAPYTMDPAGTVTRGMLVALLYRFSGDDLGTDWERTNTFSDVNQTYYYASAIEWAHRNNIVNGYSATQFGPDDLVTRQQMCKMVYAFLNYLETPLPEGEDCSGQFADYDEIADWAMESLEAMISAGLIQGDGVNVTPNAGANRAQFCVLLTRVRDYVDNYEPPLEPDPTDPSEPTLPPEPTEPEPTEPEPTEPEPTEPNPTEPEPTEPEPTEPEPTEPDPTEPEPTEPDPTEPEPTEPEPTEPEPTEPVHECTWKINKTDVSINVGEKFQLYLICSHPGCYERPDFTWTAETEGVVDINGTTVTGLTAGARTNVTTECDGVVYKCIVRVRKEALDAPVVFLPI